MPATTTQGVPYPLGTDRVSDGDNAIQALAQWVDSSITFGACTLASDTGPGPNASQWFTNCQAIASGGGVTQNTNGLIVPRKGYYVMQATAIMQVGQAGTSASRLVIGDGAAQWAYGSVVFVVAGAWDHSVSCMTVAQLNPGTAVRWGMVNSGAAGGGIYGGANKSVLLVRLLVPLS